MARSFGRVTIDDRGVRKAPLLWLFGTPFEVLWGDVTAWATSETVLADGGVEQVMSRSVEIHTAATVHFAGVSAADFAAAVGELEGRLPGKRTESILVTMQQFRRKGS